MGIPPFQVSAPGAVLCHSVPTCRLPPSTVIVAAACSHQVSAPVGRYEARGSSIRNTRVTSHFGGLASQFKSAILGALTGGPERLKPNP